MSQLAKIVHSPSLRYGYEGLGFGSCIRIVNKCFGFKKKYFPMDIIKQFYTVNQLLMCKNAFYYTNPSHYQIDVKYNLIQDNSS